MNNKVIKVLNEEHGIKVIEFFKQYCDTGDFVGDSIGSYYGIIYGKFDVWIIDEVTEANAKIIELPEENTYRLGKDTQGNNFNCVSGTIELPEEKTYPRVMLVSNDNINFSNRRVVFMEKRGVFLAWSYAETIEGAENEIATCSWNYAKEIEPIEVTLEDIAEWKGVSKEQITIKN